MVDQCSKCHNPIWAILPLKDFVNAKQRLSGVLAPHERRRLFHCMVEDVLDVLSKHPAIEQTVIVSDDPSAELLANQHAMIYWSESSLNTSGLNAVISHTAQKLQRQGVKSVMIVHGDLPLMSRADVQQLVDSHRELNHPAVSIAPDTERAGSNCMLCTPPTAVDFQYGEQSFQKHQRTALNTNVAFNVVPLPGIARDIDDPVDLDALLAATSKHSFDKKRSIHYLHNSGIAERLTAMAIGRHFDSKKIHSEKNVADTLFPANVRELP
jgi:2-phospho-L-lactate guanylyltransferase